MVQNPDTPTQSDGRTSPAYTVDESSRCLPEGLYVLINKKTRTVLDLYCGNTGIGASVTGCERNVNENIDHQLWIIRPSQSERSYSIMSFRGGTVLDLEAGKRGDKSRVFAWKRVETIETGRLNQEWRIARDSNEYHTLQCVRTGTFLEITDGKSHNGAGVSCSSKARDYDHQLWNLERVSRSGREIKTLFGSWKPDFMSQLAQPYGDDVESFALPHRLRTNVWEGTRLSRQSIRKGTFDSDDFVVKMKDAANSWARDRLRLDGHSVLCGIIYGEARRGPKAYNWYLSSDMSSLVFFDAQTNREYSTRTLDEFGFKPTFGVF